MKLIKYRESIKICIFMVLLYLVQFCVFPNLFPIYYPRSNEAFVLYYVTLLTTAILCAAFISIKPVDYILGDIVYFFLATLYSANGAYNYLFTTETFFNLLSLAFFLIFWYIPMVLWQGVTMFTMWLIKCRLKK